jgi:hypothetical protein
MKITDEPVNCFFHFECEINVYSFKTKQIKKINNN